ncbi:MAG: hypothetical protein NTW19_19810 [Planctomycetota bacterium]|nr:hypothetical protein [Planctomycetota bacterium]
MSTATASGTTIHGLLLEKGQDSVVVQLPGTDYKLHLAVDAGALAKLPAPNTGVRVAGRITARAKRVDIVRAGGRFVDPVIGRPRRIQGCVAAVDAHANTITVSSGIPAVVTLTMNQRAESFPLGALVAFDVERGARFEPA